MRRLEKVRLHVQDELVRAESRQVCTGREWRNRFLHGGAYARLR